MMVTSISPANLDRLFETPKLVRHLYDCAPGSLAAADLPRDQLDLDKAWGGVHLALTGTDWEGEGPAAFLLHGGVDIGDIDLGYGPARGIRPESLASISEALGAVSDARIEERLRVGYELDVYALSGDPAEDLEWVRSSIDELRAFVDQAIATGAALVIAMR